MIQLSKRHPVLHRRHFFRGRKIRGSEVKDLTWFRPDGKEMRDEDWNNPETRCIGLRMAGDAIDETDEHGNAIADDTLLVLLNSQEKPVEFVLPGQGADRQWTVVLDSSKPSLKKQSVQKQADRPFMLAARSLMVLSCQSGKNEQQKKGHGKGKKANYLP
jgi:isoamylase